jgi:predicted ferric reductase
MGTMTLMENIRTPLVFLAGGIGMTPFYSMILYIYEKKLTVPVTLFVSFSSLEEVVFYEELMNIAKERENITIIYTISEPITPSTPWDGETGRISKELLQKYLVDIPKQTFFIVGSATMVDSIEKLVQSMGVSESSIIRETYPGY